MLFRKRDTGIRKKRPLFLLPLLLALMISLSACRAGYVAILDSPNGRGVVIDYKEWSEKNKCELSMSKNEVLQITVDREGGKIALNIRGKDGGSEPYTGNDLQSGTFTVTVSETDHYVIQISGNDASGRMTLKNLGIKTE